METSSGTKDSTPSWINTSFLERALRSSEEDLQVTSYQVSPATAPGDNYSSIMYRIKVHFTRKGQSETRSIILKAEPSGDESAKISEEACVFLRESSILANIIPKIHSLIQNATSEKVPPFAAECLYSQIGHPATVIVLEDLKVGGFKMAERTEGLDKEHCFLVLRTLAKYHAASVVQYNKDPELFDMFIKKVQNEEQLSNTILESFFGNGTRYLAKEMENWPEFDKRFSQQIEKISKIAAKYFIHLGKKKDGDFNVLTHGDLWVNNLMFRYSDTTGEVQEVRFLDFPLGNINNAAIDLLYFLHTSPTIELINHHHIFLEEYHKTLGDTFELLGCKHLHPTFQQLKKQIDNAGLYAVIVSCTVLPMIRSDRTDVPDIEKIWKNEMVIRYSERYRKVLKLLLPIFEEKGWLNVENFCTV